MAMAPWGTVQKLSYSGCMVVDTYFYCLLLRITCYSPVLCLLVWLMRSGGTDRLPHMSVPHKVRDVEAGSIVCKAACRPAPFTTSFCVLTT